MIYREYVNRTDNVLEQKKSIGLAELNLNQVQNQKLHFALFRVLRSSLGFDSVTFRLWVKCSTVLTNRWFARYAEMFMLLKKFLPMYSVDTYLKKKTLKLTLFIHNSTLRKCIRPLYGLCLWKSWTDLQLSLPVHVAAVGCIFPYTYARNLAQFLRYLI